MKQPKPSTFKPFARWFTNERKRELQEVEALYWQVKAQADAFTHDALSIGQLVYPIYRDLPEPLRDRFSHAMFELLTEEPGLQELPPPAFEKMSLGEFVKYRNTLLAREYFYRNAPELVNLLAGNIAAVFEVLVEQLPETEEPSPFSIPLVYAFPEAREFVSALYGTFCKPELVDRGIFKKLADQLHENVCRVSGRDPTDRKSTKPFKHAEDSDLPLDRMVETYLAGTPLRDLMEAKIPLRLTRDDRMNHMHIVGGTGAGKTTLIERLLLHDLQSEDPPSVVLIDPHGDLIRKLVKSDLGLTDRLVYIDPRDIQHPPALNVFSLNKTRLEGYDEATREQVTAGVIQTFDYLFSGLFGAELTGKQSVFFRYVARLMLAMPESMGRNATILDMMRLMEDAEPYLPAIATLPDIQREFFEKDFRSKTFQQTKEQIRYRLQAVIENPTIARLFTSEETKLDLFDALNRGSIILVDTAKDFLKGSSSTFGRILISLVLQAVLERSAIPAGKRKDTFLIVDEAASYFDSNIDDLLTEARKYRCGLVLAHQYLDQAAGPLKASLHANTGIKFASGISAADARAMATEMRTTPDFILGQPKLQFAAHIRNVTPHAVSIPIEPAGRLPQLSDAEYASLIAANRERVSLTEEEKLKPEGPTVIFVRSDGTASAERPKSSIRREPRTRHHEEADDEW